uniref:THAP-type domain-containing protein n=1 Tax=Fundulus heteroclitus TaxID=8078 RepID=A0A3Q2NWG3_FUNHE
MVNTCSTVGCTNRQKKDNIVKIHRFPADEIRVRLDDPSKPWEPKSHRICSVHFTGGCVPQICFYRPVLNRETVI